MYQKRGWVGRRRPRARRLRRRNLRAHPRAPEPPRAALGESVVGLRLRPVAQHMRWRRGRVAGCACGSVADAAYSRARRLGFCLFLGAYTLVDAMPWPDASFCSAYADQARSRSPRKLAPPPGARAGVPLFAPHSGLARRSTKWGILAHNPPTQHHRSPRLPVRPPAGPQNPVRRLIGRPAVHGVPGWPMVRRLATISPIHLPPGPATLRCATLPAAVRRGAA